MKNKLYYILTACVVLVALLLGLSGSFVLADEQAGVAAVQDRLVGVLVTNDYLDLFDAESYFEDHAPELFNGATIDGDASSYQGRLFATLKVDTYTDETTGETHASKSYDFENVDGIEYFYARIEDEQGSYSATFGNEAVSDGQSAFNYTDEGSSVKLEGIIYVAATNTENTLYFNPVYQAANGSIYALSGSGFSSGDIVSEGEVYSQTISATYTETVSGKIVTDSIDVKMTIRIMFTPAYIRVIQLDENSAVLSAEEYAPGTLPESFLPDENTAYIVVEAYKTATDGNKAVTRTLYERGCESIETYRARADGVCIKQFTALNWDEQT